MKKRVILIGTAVLLLASGLAVAQTVRVPAQTPNVAIAPASAVDVAAFQERLQQLENSHNQTRTELAQARLQLTATQSQLTQTRAELSAAQGRLGAAVTRLRQFGQCQRYVNADLPIPSPMSAWCDHGVDSDHLEYLRNLE